MSSTQVRKPKPESYEYSWFLPAGGHNPSAIGSQIPPSELEADPAKAQDPEMAAMEARTEKWRHSGETKARADQAKLWHIDPTRLRLTGMAGWSAIAVVGGLTLATRAGPFPGVQLGILGGVWAGISVLIWFLPGKL